MAKSLKKPTAPPPPLADDVTTIASWEECDQALGALRLTEAALARTSAELDVEIQRLQEAKQLRAAPLLARRKRLEALVEAWCTREKDAFGAPGKPRTRKLVHGTVGWRLTPPKLVFRQPVELVLRMLKVRGHDACVIVAEEIDKSKVAALAPSEHRYLGVQVEQDDRLVLKLATDDLVEYPETSTRPAAP